MRPVGVGRPFEHVGMPADQLVADAVDRVAQREVPGLVADLRQEHGLEEEVAQLLAQVGRRAVLDGVEHLVGLLEHERAQRGERLLAIPRTAVGGAQRAHDVEQALESGPAESVTVAMLPSGVFDARIASD